MSQQMNSTPAWQGAAQVASARLRTIDQALAKLEAAVPDNLPSNSDQPADGTGGPGGESTSGSDKSNPIEAQMSQKDTEQPKPIPTSSLQALDTFLMGAA